MSYRGLPPAGVLTGKESLRLAQEDGQGVSVTLDQIASAVARMLPAASLGNVGSVPVANRTHFPYNGLSSGANVMLTYRTMYYSRQNSRVIFPRLVYNNSQLTSTGEAAGNAQITIKAAIEYGGVSYPVNFGGSRTKVLAVDDMAVSDPVMMTIPADSQYFVRTNVTVGTLGEKWPVQGTLLTAQGESYSTSDTTDAVTSMGANAASGYGPSCILGQTVGNLPVVCITGSSSGWGQGDTVEAPYYDFGYLSRALSSNAGYIKLTRASATMLQFLTTNTRQLKFINTVKPTHFIQQLGSNDITNGANLATLQDRCRQMWDILGATGAKVYQCTATPITASSDSWATLSGQTKNANNDTRVAFNDWLRSVPRGVDGIIECCNVVETSLNSGYWITDGNAGTYTADGQHLTQLAHRLTAAAMKDDLIKLINK